MAADARTLNSLGFALYTLLKGQDPNAPAPSFGIEEWGIVINPGSADEVPLTLDDETVLLSLREDLL